MDDIVKKVLYSEEDIQAKTKELGEIITRDYKGKDLLVICVLKGAVMFVTDLIKRIDLPLEIDFMAVSSYGNSTVSSGIVRILKDLDKEICGKHLLIVEDIIDTGLTLSYLIENLKARNPASVSICTLLDKPGNRKADIDIKYTGFDCPDEFVVGYGLDYAEKYRNIPFIFILKEEVYQNK